VDDAIVMIENIVRHIEDGESPLDAALRGAREIGFTVISLTFSLIAVFIPLLFMTGLVGRMFREFALTLTIAVVVSAIVSLTLTPMMCAKLLRHDHGGSGNPGTRWFNDLVEGSVAFHGGRLSITLRPRGNRNAEVDTIISRLKNTIADVPGMTVYFQPVQDIQISTRPSRAQYQYTLVATDAHEVALWSDRLVESLRQNPT